MRNREMGIRDMVDRDMGDERRATVGRHAEEDKGTAYGSRDGNRLGSYRVHNYPNLNSDTQ